MITQREILAHDHESRDEEAVRLTIRLYLAVASHFSSMTLEDVLVTWERGNLYFLLAVSGYERRAVGRFLYYGDGWQQVVDWFLENVPWPH